MGVKDDKEEILIKNINEGNERQSENQRRGESERTQLQRMRA